MPINALLRKLADDHESAGESAVAFQSDIIASCHFRVVEAAHNLIGALAECEQPAPVAVRVIPIAAGCERRIVP